MANLLNERAVGKLCRLMFRIGDDYDDPGKDIGRPYDECQFFMARWEQYLIARWQRNIEKPVRSAACGAGLLTGCVVGI